MNAQATQMKHVTAELINIIGGSAENLHITPSGNTLANISELRKVLRLAGTGRKDKSPAHHAGAMKGRQVTKHSSIDDSNFSDF
jgi:hypothetical protein